MSRESERLYDGVTQIEDDVIEAAQRPKRRRRALWMAPVAVVLALAILAGVLNGRGGLRAYAVAEAVYPEQKERRGGNWDTFSQQAVTGFAAASIPRFLTGLGDENRIYSPINLYMGLSMLAEVTDGETRAQVLSLLGVGDLSVQRQRAGLLWNSYYREGNGGKCLLANSLWMDQAVGYVQETLDTLAQDYYASSYAGQMGSAAYDKAIQSWIREQTGGRLQKQASGISTDPETLLMLVSTVYFRGKWHAEFDRRDTAPQTFHAAAGDMTCDFMHKARMAGMYYWAERFSAVSQYFRNGFTMWYILPDEGVTPAELLGDARALSFMTGDREDIGHKNMYINLAVPKFDVSSNLDLRDGLQALGVRDVFDWEKADFSPMTREIDEVYLSRAAQAARVTVDEEGCTAAAYVDLGAAGAAAPPTDEVDFTLDRPFLFVIEGPGGLPLFVGVVNRPVE